MGVVTHTLYTHIYPQNFSVFSVLVCEKMDIRQAIRHSSEMCFQIHIENTNFIRFSSMKMGKYDPQISENWDFSRVEPTRTEKSKKSGAMRQGLGRLMTPSVKAKKRALSYANKWL